YQNGISTSCSNRATSDISADADPNSGITIYVNGATSQYGGTSLATPIVAGIWALAGTPNAGDNAVTYPYAHQGNFYDVTSGSNGSCGTVICTAGTGWDGPTGFGTPNGVTGLTPGTPSGTVTVKNPGDQTSTTGTAVSLQISASGGSTPYGYAAQGLPAGLTIDAKSGLISGTPTTAGTSKVTVTVTDAAGKSGTTSFTWTVGEAGKLAVTNPGEQSSVVGKAVSLQVTASGGSTPYGYAAQGLPAGLTIDAKSGLISGTPTAAGTSKVTVTVTDAAGATAQTSFGWTVTAAPSSPLTAVFTTDYVYQGGAFGHFTLTNTGRTATSGWTLSFTLAPNESLSLTNPGTASGSTGHVVVTGQNAISAGESLTVSQIYRVTSGAFTPPSGVTAS
uniref:putative Ig domain-containing protein n=1 Tax=Amycolatopsis sp. lyj-23 TaxID=2789283 RepID=UPI00397AD2CD